MSAYRPTFTADEELELRVLVGRAWEAHHGTLSERDAGGRGESTSAAWPETPGTGTRGLSAGSPSRSESVHAIVDWHDRRFLRKWERKQRSFNLVLGVIRGDSQVCAAARALYNPDGEVLQ